MKEFIFNMQVFSEDTDSFGIVHHANFIKFMERARLAWWFKLGIRLDELFAEGIFFVIKKIEIEYITPARLYDELQILSRILQTRRVAKTYQQTIRSKQNLSIEYCKAMIHVVCVNDKMKPCAIPDKLLEYYK
jgi:acyl-CoA thioester hydrolase